MRSRTVARPRIRARYLAVAGPVAVFVFVIGTFAATLSWPEYDHRVQPLSDLGGIAAPAPVIQNLTFFMFGAAVVVFGAGLSAARLGGLVAALVAGFGVAMASLSVLPCSPGCAPATATDAAHALAAVLGFVAVAGAMLMLGRRDTVGSAWFGRASAVTGAVTLALLVVWLVAGEVDPVGWRAGLLQRGMVGTVLVWLGEVGCKLNRPPRQPLMGDGTR